MKIKLLALMSILTFLLFSCGQSAKEKLKTQQLLQDAITNAMKEKAAKENQILIIKADLEVAYDKMQQIKEFQFGRTPDERESQIRNQTLYIEKLKKSITSANDDINELQLKIAKLQLDLKEIE